MLEQDTTAWLRRAIGELPRVVAHSYPHGGIEYRVGDVELGFVHDRGTVELDAGPTLAGEVVRSGWAAPCPQGPAGRLTIDLSQPQGGTVALWLLCRNHRWAAACASFDTPDTPPSIRMLDQSAIGSLPSS